MSLVADYGTSSESGSESEEDSSENTETNQKVPEKLPTPDFGVSASVFSNPFVEAENAKKAILEKHVKMVPSREDTKLINGKKICWNYRKGRCRFGHKCQYAHDSDLHKSAEEMEEKRTIIAQTNRKETSKRKRPGLTQGLVPGKKVMKIFNQQQDKEKPWNNH